jgi:hypothetical protein
MCRLALKKLGKVKGEGKEDAKEREGNIVPRNASNRDVEIETGRQGRVFFLRKLAFSHPSKSR